MLPRTSRSTALLLLLLQPVVCLVAPPLSQLLKDHATTIAELQSHAPNDESEVSLLRYALAEDPKAQFDATLAWQTSARGKSILTAAQSAVQEAKSSKGSWNNDAVLAAAPHGASIREYLTPASCVTTTASNGDLVYCIRAGAIDDTALMEAVSVEQLVDFFLYAKHVNALVANERSIEQDRLVSILTCNDLSGVKLVGGSAAFRSALSESSKQATAVFPTSLAGPTLLLNLPRLLSALVKLFTPLFPEPVKKKIKFEQGLLKGVTDLRTIATSSTNKDRTEFLQQLDAILAK